VKVLIAGGGTGGHVVPALAIARELRDRHGAEVRLVGTARGLENRLVPAAGFPLELIRVGQFNNVSLKTRIATLADLPRGILRCRKLLEEFRPDVVIGVGGYASGPAMMAAILSRIPTLAYEPNAVPGLANRIVGRWVSAAAVNSESACRYFHNAKVTGVPVRPEFFAIAPRPAQRETGPMRLQLLVFGGSQGSRFFNQIMPRIAAALLRSMKAEVSILHQSGATHYESTMEAYRASGANPAQWKVVAYLDDMPQRFADSDLILCRSGATTVAELAAAGRASLLVPFPQATDDHQRWNAEVLVKAAGAKMLTEQDIFDPTVLLSELMVMLNEHRSRWLMATKVRALAHPDALAEIAAEAERLAKK
jgi:UDP-N-acetylglucosamine--N-acetylmuramyl-(pentapeptide) pyrophosphoryl-undecaprenol N-acetylglucosamine transferase